MTRKVYQADFGSQADQMVLSAQTNPIHNGEFSVWQRGATFTSMADGAYMADRWLFRSIGSTAVLDCSQGAVPSRAALVPGSNYSLALTVTTADAVIAAGDAVWLEHDIEGYNWFPFIEKQFTVGFWVYATVNATYCVAARNTGGTQSCVIEYTINASNTWEYKTVTFPAPPTSGFVFTNGVGVRLTWALAVGSTYWATPGSWSASNALATTNQVDAVGTNGNVFLLWGVTMGLGTTVAPFWPRSFGEELALCQRYYWKTFDYGTAPAQNAGTSGSLNYVVTNAGAGNGPRIRLPLAVPMRAAPTVTMYNTGAANDKWRNVSLGADSGTGTAANGGDWNYYIANPQLAGDLATHVLMIQATASADL